MAEAPRRVVLVGNPNCGKTSLFNALTGSRQKVANYPGVTVERKEGVFSTPQGRKVELLDLPGTYSLRARSPDEEIARDVILGRIANEPVPDIVLCVADASNPRLSLRLALELRNVCPHVGLVLNMADIARHRGIDIDIERLSSELKIPVVPCIAVRPKGTNALLSLLDKEITALREVSSPVPRWTPPSPAEICVLQKEADRIAASAVKIPPRQGVTPKLDAVLLHPVWGLLILLAVLFLMFQAVFTWAEPPMNALKMGIGFLADLASQFLPEGLLRHFVHDALICGVGAVAVFLPQILILFFFILLLEDSGYMARAAFLMDKIMGAAGLHGRAFIPLLSSFACAIPAIMATRVIDNRRDRLTTILIAPLMPCSARIPVYALIIAAFFPATKIWGVQLQGLVMFGLYALGILSGLAAAYILRRTLWRRIPTEPFLMELPDYKAPNLRNIAYGLLQRASLFLRRAGTTIAAITILVWALAAFPQSAPNAAVPAIETSYAARIGKAIEPVFAPLGFNWKINVALISGMAAREVAVATLGTVYSIEESGKGEAVLGSALASEWSLATALALLAWYAFAPQCASTLMLIRKETGSLKWMLFSFGYMITLAYAAAFIAYRVGGALTLPVG
ncbi:MAG: ferrous iron transport protein B [Alphaproteobacteria bacterium]|nr:ferrous iron transport protein B [Alphaproteobacteria bacterium]